MIINLITIVLMVVISIFFGSLMVNIIFDYPPTKLDLEDHCFTRNLLCNALRFMISFTLLLVLLRMFMGLN